MSRNSLLPKRSIRWRSGPLKGQVGIPPLPPPLPVEAEPAPSGYVKDPRGRKPKAAKADTPADAPPADARPPQVARPAMKSAHPNAGRLSFCAGAFFAESSSGWGGARDMLAIAHGPVGCGVFAEASRLHLPGLIQGVESFTTLDASSNLSRAELDADGGDAKLARALAEAAALFPKASGFAVLNEDPIALVDANVRAVARDSGRALERFVLPLSCEAIREQRRWVVEAAAAFKAAAAHHPGARAGRLDVVLPFFRDAAGLVHMVSLLLHQMGLNPVPALTGSSVADMARVSTARLVLGFADTLDTPVERFSNNFAGLFSRWFGAPIVPVCFASPGATDASLRAIAAHFGPRVRARTERIIAANAARTQRVVARYRPRLEGRLVVHFDTLSEEQTEPYRMLGLRTGTPSGWTSRAGAPRTPRIACDAASPSARALDSYVREARPDLVVSADRDEFDWRKRGQATLPLSPLFDRRGNAFWGYDGFALLAAAVDRAVNAPWRKLVKPPWPRRAR